MKLCLIVLLIFTGVIPLVTSLSRLYYLIQQKKSWSEAQNYCRDQYTDLAIIKSSDELANLVNVARLQLFFSNAWIGLYTNINMWYWSFKNESVGSFTSWYPGEPNNVYGNETCSYAWLGYWYDAPCKWELQFLCLDDKANATEPYVFVQLYKTWYDAQSYCRLYYTDLASARNETENSVFYEKTLRHWSWAWFGLMRYPWKWADQTTNVSALTWWGGSIYDYLQNKSCVNLYGGLATVEKCSNTMPFFCYLFPVQQKIIKMKLKSSEDVNDPAIISAINEKIKQKLQEHGMTGNITVTWRKQPDGEVFHKEVENITTGN